MKLLGHTVCISIAFRDTAKQFPKEVVHIYTSTSNVRECQQKRFFSSVRVWLDTDVKLGKERSSASRI